MKFFRELSIKNKLIFIILTISASSVFIGFIIVIFLDIHSFRNEMIDQTVLIAQVVGDNSISELAFEDHIGSQETLGRLSAINNIVYAAIFDRNDRLFSTYNKTGTVEPAPEVKTGTPFFEDGFLHVYRVINYDNEKYGTIYLRVSESPLNMKVIQHLVTLLLIAAGIITISVTFALKFQGIISNPILNLANATKVISAEDDYSIRVKKEGEDEIGILCDGFNNMLSQLEKRKSELDKAIIALRKSETKFRNMIVQANDPIFVLAKGNFVFINPKFEDYFGYSLEEMAQGNFTLLNLVSDEFTDKILEIFKKTSKGEEIIQQHDIKGISKTGEKYDFEINFSIINWDKENAILGTLRDITKRKEALEELKDKHRELNHMRMYIQNIIDSMPSILIGVNNEGIITQWNMEATKASGIMKIDAEGKFLGDIFPFLADQMKNVTKAIDEKQSQKSERVMNRRKDKTLYNDIMVYPLISNGVEGAVIRVDDITSRVQIEAMMVQTEKMLSVGGLAAGMAHEINNPLGGILMSAQNLLRRISPELEKNIKAAEEAGTTLEAIHDYMEKRGLIKMLEGIMEMGERASKIVTNMLSFSRRSESRMAPIDLVELMDKTIELAANDYDLKKKYDFKHIKILRKYDKKMPLVQCIATEIEQVLLNLVKNASQAMMDSDVKTEDPTITLKIKHIDSFARIEISDNGPGIAKENIKRVFEPFFTTKQVGIGTGLGLSVSYFIITDNHRGSLEVKSAPGEGANFIINIPIEGVKA